MSAAVRGRGEPRLAHAEYPGEGDAPRRRRTGAGRASPVLIDLTHRKQKEILKNADSSI